VTGLLDVNVLVALAWPNHVHHGPAVTWFLEHQRLGWATAPVTEAGFVRVSSNTAAIPSAVPPAIAIEMLERFRALDHHEFWVDDVALAGAEHVEQSRIVSHAQVTDAHLLALAMARGGRLVTFDRRVGRLVSDARTDVLEVIPV
jgi:uncharacterized protein